MSRPLRLALLAVAFSAGPVRGDEPAAFLGPTPYLSQADSPFDLSGLGATFFLETFEDNQLDVPGVTASTGYVSSPGTFTDSVDADDGAVDGLGRNGRSWFVPFGVTGVTFTFDPVALGGYPAAAGVVWTDGSGTTTFEAFDRTGASLGTTGPVAIADGSIFGTTAEDRFFGVLYADGIGSISITNATGGMEVDHLQYGNLVPVTTTTTTSTTTTSTTTTTTTSVTEPPTTTTSTSTTSTSTVPSTTPVTSPLLVTTTTTLPPDVCAAEPVGPTFRSLACRLDALAARIGSASEIQRQQAQLLGQVAKATARRDDAENRCVSADTKRARKGLKDAARKMVQLGHRLGSKAGRGSMPEALRAELIAAAKGIKADLQTLRRALGCPADAPAG